MTLACKNYYPDTEVFGRYDAMWQEDPLKPAVGVNLNLPIYRGRLDSAVREARFTASQPRADMSNSFSIFNTMSQPPSSRWKKAGQCCNSIPSVSFLLPNRT